MLKYLFYCKIQPILTCKLQRMMMFILQIFNSILDIIHGLENLSRVDSRFVLDFRSIHS